MRRLPGRLWASTTSSAKPEVGYTAYHNAARRTEPRPHIKIGNPYLITERRVPELIPVLGSQPAGDVSHRPGGKQPLLSARPAVTNT